MHQQSQTSVYMTKKKNIKERRTRMRMNGVRHATVFYDYYFYYCYY